MSATRTADTLHNILDSKTGQWVTFSKVTKWADGTPMSDALVDGTIYVKSPLYPGEYFRRNTNTYTVKMFGAVGDGITNDTVAFQKGLDFLESIRGGVLMIPEGKYLLSPIYIGTRVKMVGAGMNVTQLLPALYASAVPFGLINIKRGPIQFVELSDFAIWGNVQMSSGSPPVNANQWGLYLWAQWDVAYTQGGLWNSTIKNVIVSWFNNGIWSRAGYTVAHGLLPNQHVYFENVTAVVFTNGEGLRLTGQHGQCTFSNSTFKGFGTFLAAYCVNITFDPNPSEIAVDGVHGESSSDVAGVANATRSAKHVYFTHGSTFQTSKVGFRMWGADNMIVDHCWFENNGNSIKLEGASKLNVTNNRFANSADSDFTGDNSPGSIMILLDKSFLDFGSGNMLAGQVDNILSPTTAYNTIAGLNFTAHSIQAALTDTTDKFPRSSPSQVALASDGSVDVGNVDDVLITANADRSINLSRIKSTISPGGLLLVRASAGNITINNAGNIAIDAGTRTEYTIVANSMIGLIRVIGYAVDWLMVIHGVNYKPALPADGEYYSKGTVIWNTNIGTGTPAGWICSTAGLAGTTAIFQPLNMTLNGLAGAQQSLGIGVAGLAPGWNSAVSTHTLNIPMASQPNVTAGLLSKVEYDKFNAATTPVTDAVEAAYAGTDTWDGTQPSGTKTITYQWTKSSNKLVTVRFCGLYTVAGATNTKLTLTWPADMPLPKLPTGFTLANQVLYMGEANAAGTTTAISINCKSSIVRNAANDGFLFQINTVSAAVLVFELTISYWTT